jgi:hypothetical protein
MLRELRLLACFSERERKKGRKGDEKKEQKRTDAPFCAPTLIHVAVDVFVDIVCFLVVGFIRCSRKQPILVVWILELLWVNLSLLATAGLGFAVRCGERAGGSE